MNETKNKIFKVVRKGIVADHYGYARETWRALGGGEKYLKHERRSWRNDMNHQKMSRIQVQFPSDLLRWLKTESTKRKIGVSTLTREIITEDLQKLVKRKKR